MGIASISTIMPCRDIINELIDLMAPLRLFILTHDLDLWMAYENISTKSERLEYLDDLRRILPVIQKYNNDDPVAQFRVTVFMNKIKTRRGIN